MFTSSKCLLGISALMIPFAVNAKKVEQPKKVVFIAIDDLNDWVGFLGGHPNTITPNMDRLASMGVVFEKAYCAAPVSNPSRAAMLSGLRPSTSGVYGNLHLFRESEYAKDVVTMPQYFMKHGYTTMAKGKIFHNPTGAWSDPQSWSVQEPYEASTLIPPGQDKDWDPKKRISVNGIGVSHDWGVVECDMEETADYYSCQWAAEQVLKEHDGPTFIACGVFRPHVPWYVPQKYFDMHPLESIADPLYNDADVLDLPQAGLNKTGYNKENDEYNIIKRSGKEKEAVRAYLACISYADDCLGVLVDALESNPDKENTIIVMVADHGYHLGEKMHYSKMSLWDRSCRLPMVIVAPGVGTPGTRCAQPVNLIDLYPTLVDLAGLPQNEVNDGRSLRQQLKHPDKRLRIPSITTLGQNSHSLCDGEYRYIIYSNGDEELYDHNVDPMEWYNIANDPAYDKVIERLRGFIPKVNREAMPNEVNPHRYIM